jgi:FtsH-binding integral membrane protein
MNDNPYQQTYPASRGNIAADAQVSERAAFIRNTYLHLLGAILALVAIDAFIITAFDTQLQGIVPMVTSGWNWMFVLGAFMGVSYIADRWAHSNTSRSMQYVGLGTYVVAEALLFVPLLYIANHFAPGAIGSAGIVTAFVFSGLTLIVFLTKYDFSMLRSALCVGGLVAMALIVAGIAFGFSLGLWFSVAMVILASGSILYSTSNVLRHYHTSQHVAASLSLFASVALMFWYVLQIFMHFDE